MTANDGKRCKIRRVIRTTVPLTDELFGVTKTGARAFYDVLCRRECSKTLGRCALMEFWMSSRVLVYQFDFFSIIATPSIIGPTKTAHAHHRNTDHVRCSKASVISWDPICPHGFSYTKLISSVIISLFSFEPKTKTHARLPLRSTLSFY